MGDRANVLVKDNDSDSGVCLYTHSGGTYLPRVLRRALARRERWDDAQYLTRIIFCEMVPKDMWGLDVGFGISSLVGDGASRVLVVNVEKQTVSFKSITWTFNEYVDGSAGEVW